MRIAYDAEVDILVVDFDIKRIGESAEVIPGVIADFDSDGQVIGFEIMDASKFTDLSHIKIFLSRWGDEERVLDADGNLSVSPLKAKAASAGD